jgi:ABC-type taurine transport system ATPase subunit
VFQDPTLDHWCNARGSVMLGLEARGVARSERVVGILGQPI